MKIQIFLAVVLQIVVQASSFPDLGTTDMLDHDTFKRQLFGQDERDLTTAYGTNFFADSQQTYYDPYQMAWRFLGHMVKCGYPSDRYEQQSQHSHSNDNNNEFGKNYCQRYLLWAAVSKMSVSLYTTRSSLFFFRKQQQQHYDVSHIFFATVLITLYST